MFDTWTPEEKAKRLHARFEALKTQGIAWAKALQCSVAPIASLAAPEIERAPAGALPG